MSNDMKMYNGYVDDDHLYIDEQPAAAGNKGVFFPTCRFCGKQTLPDADYESQETADEAATLHCDCYEARQYQDEMEKVERRRENIARLRQRLDDLMSYCETHNVTLDDGTHDLLLRCGVAVLDGAIGKATINWARLKISFSLNNKGVIIIGYAYSDGGKIEV